MGGIVVPPKMVSESADRHVSQALLDAIIESLPFRVWACDLDGRCTFQNSKSLQELGNLVGKLPHELPLRADQLESWRQTVDRAFRGEAVWSEAPLEIAGEERWYRYLVAPIREGDSITGVVGIDLDMTTLRQTQAALASSEERLRCVTENAPDFIIQIQRDGVITYINRAYPDLDSAAVIGTNVANWIPPSYRPVVQAAIDRCFDGAEVCRYETEGFGRDGQLAWYSSRVSPVVLGGTVASAIIIASDMTESQRAAAALRESEERFRQLASSIDEGFWLIDLQPERLLYVNPAFERIWGVSAESLYATLRGGEALVHPIDLPSVRQRFGDWLAGSCETYDVEYRIVRPDGVVRWVHDRGAKICDPGGRFYRASGIVRDITEQKAAEQALRESEARSRLLADNSSDLISRHRPDGQWFYVSPAARALLGYDPQHLAQIDPFTLVHPDDLVRITHGLAELVATRQAPAITARIRRSDQTWGWFEVQGRAVLDPASGQLTEIVCTSRDVTQRMEAARQLRQREAELAHAERLSTMGQMAAELAHELNQPLYAIANFADACLGRVQQLQACPASTQQQAELANWIGQIGQQARRAGEVVRRLTQFVRKGELDRELLQLNDLVRDVAILLEFGVRNRSTQVAFDLAYDLPPIEADRLLIEQVLVNLVRNAAEAMEETPPERRRVCIRTYRDGDGRVGLVVTDAGIGLPTAQLDRLFEPYFTTKSDGTGMGLAICRSTIEAHGGRIWATNNAEGGATVQFTLPAARAPP
jgi:PAS domain S-box-containing protein